MKLTLVLFSVLTSLPAFAGGGGTGGAIVCDQNEVPKQLHHCSVASVEIVNPNLLSSFSVSDRAHTNELLTVGNQFSSFACRGGGSHGTVTAPGYGQDYLVHVDDTEGGSIAVQLHSGAFSTDRMPRVERLSVTFQEGKATMDAIFWSLKNDGGLKFNRAPLATFICQ